MFVIAPLHASEQVLEITKSKMVMFQWSICLSLTNRLKWVIDFFKVITHGPQNTNLFKSLLDQSRE